MFNSTLPDGLLPLGDVEGMRHFLSELITPPQPTSMYTQLYVAIGIVFGCVILALGIVTRQLATGSAWLVQVHHTTRGAFLMPNAVMSLAVFFAIHELSSNAMGLVVAKFYRDGYQANYLLFRALFAFPAFLAALTSCAGTLGLFPDALRFRGQEHNKLRLLLLHPITFHAFLFGVPVLCFVTVLTPALIGNCIFNKVPAMHKLWLERSHDPSVAVTQLAAEARDIWLDVTHAYYYDSVVFGIWVAWVCVLGIVMFSIALHVLLSVRSQVKAAERKKQALEMSQPSFQLFSSQPKYNNTVSDASLRKADQPMFDGPASIVTNAGGAFESIVKGLKRGPLPSVLSSVSQVALAGKRLTRAQAASRRYTALKLVYRNLFVQYAAILLGTLGLGSNALLVALTSYRSSRAVITMSAFHQAAVLMVCYVNVLCIGGVIVIILWRSLDPAFTIGTDADAEEAGSPVRASFVRSRSTSPTLSQAPPSPFGAFSSAESSAFRGSTIDLSMDKA